MIRAARVVWLLDSAAPTGAAVMAHRRHRLLAHGVPGGHGVTGVRSVRSTMLAMSGAHRAPADTPLAQVDSAAGMAGEARIARADLLVTTSARTLGSAAARRARGTRILHFLHTAPEVALTDEVFLRSVPMAAGVVLPSGVDTGRFAAAACIDPSLVSTADDFVPAQDVLVGVAPGPVVLAVGNLPAGTAVTTLVEGFAQALDGGLERPGSWRLRIAGGGPGLDEVRERIARLGLTAQVSAPGYVHDLAPHYADAATVVRLHDGDVGGLSVLEALAAGVPVIGGCDVPAVQRRVEHGRTGLVLDRTDPHEIAQALVMLGDPATRSAMAAAIRSDPGPDPAVEQRRFTDLVAGVLDQPVTAHERSRR